MADNKKFYAGVSILRQLIRLTGGGKIKMKYMLLIYLDEKVLSEEERQKCYSESIELTYQLNSQGKFLGANPLHPTATATTVRVREGRRLVTDGPFAETREQLGGYFLVEANDLDEALSIAEKIPMVQAGTVEVRPVIELDGMPN
ncbi:MAG TPA: YciI family protein [Pyrinomonadaceae bacterium]